MGQLQVQTTKLQDVKIITPPRFSVITGDSLKKLTLIETLRKPGLILTLSKITNPYLLTPEFCGVSTSNGGRQRKLS